jgi:hypothetical protein
VCENGKTIGAKCQIDRGSLVTGGTLKTGGGIAIKTTCALTEDLGGTHHAERKEEEDE